MSGFMIFLAAVGAIFLGSVTFTVLLILGLNLIEEVQERLIKRRAKKAALKFQRENSDANI